ncbi:MAG TPA: class II aldolase/adducin family protein [Phycisphaerae bacterium]|nr:class II aldolase/adducin family protein [Phycisphaerae bacterium]
MSVIDDLNALGSLMMQKGLVAGPGGNTSARDGSRMVCTPSGFDVDRVPDDKWAVVDIETGKHLSGPRPTSEWEMHLMCLKARPEMHAICHAHPPRAVGLVAGGMEILPFTPDFIAYVDHITYLPFIKPSSTEIAEAVGEAMADGTSAVSLRNHGFVTLGINWRDAYNKMLIIEDDALLQMAAIAAGNPTPLNDEQIAHVRGMEVEAFRRKVIEDDK